MDVKADYDPLPDLADLVRTAFDYNTIDANHYAERLAQQFGFIEFEDDEDGRPVPLDAGKVRAALAKALTPATPVREQATPDPAAFPLTCTWCSNSPATHLAVADWSFRDGPQRLEHMLCTTCAHGVTVLPPEVAAWWLFALVPDDPSRCKGGAR